MRHFVILAVSMLGCTGTIGGEERKLEEWLEDSCRGDEETRASEVLDAHCSRCHGAGAVAQAGLDVTDRAALVERGLVIAGDPAGSPLFARLAAGDMPPAGEEPRPDGDDVLAVEQWIACGAPVGDDTPGEPILLAEVLAAMRADLESLPSWQRQDARYVVATHLLNAGAPRASLAPAAVAKVLNSVSWSPVLVAPVAVTDSIVRIDLRTFSWQWSRVVERYPYDVEHANLDDQVLHAEAGPVPYVTADWLVAEASVPPLYDELLELPAGEAELLQALGVDAQLELEGGLAMAAGTANSGVSPHNRVLTRHGDGLYWHSSDFASSEEEDNVFTRPLDPRGTTEPGLFHFEPDGGEAIWSLPNGLHGYAIFNAAGERIAAAPTSIVVDPVSADGAVRPGRSCMGCHRDGILPATDEVRPFLEANPDAWPDEVATEVALTYPTAESFAVAQETDREFYLAALDALGLSDEGDEPVGAVAADHEADLDVARAAAELWMTPGELASSLQQDPELALLLAPLGAVEGAVIDRGAFDEAFPDVVCKLSPGASLGTRDCTRPVHSQAGDSAL